MQLPMVPDACVSKKLTMEVSLLPSSGAMKHNHAAPVAIHESHSF